MDRRPRAVFTSTGKKQMIAAITTFGTSVKPNQMVSRGAMATIGMVCSTIAHGNRAPSTARMWTKMTAARNAAALPARNPRTASSIVQRRWPNSDQPYSPNSVPISETRGRR